MIHGFSGIAVVLLIITAGFLLCKRGIITEAGTSFISTLTARVTIPCVLLTSSYGYFSLEWIREAGIWLLLPLLMVMGLYIIAVGVSRISGIPATDRGAFCNLFAHPNALAMGIPVIYAISGESGTPYLAAYFIISTVLFFGYTVNDIAKDAGQTGKGWKQRLKQLASPPLMMFLLGAALRLLEIPLPQPILLSLQYVGNMTSPLSLLLAGAVLATAETVWTPTKSSVFSIVGRVAIAPLLCLGLCLLLRVPSEIASIYVIISGLPSMNQVVVMSYQYGANRKLTVQTLLYTTILSAATIPGLLYLLGRIY